MVFVKARLKQSSWNIKTIMMIPNALKAEGGGVYPRAPVLQTTRSKVLHIKIICIFVFIWTIIIAGDSLFRKYVLALKQRVYVDNEPNRNYSNKNRKKNWKCDLFFKIYDVLIRNS